MSTIKSSAENLTLNADGANNDVIIQSNGSTKVTVDGATGNVGIGESNPDASLHITSNTPTISFDETDASQEYRIGSFGGAFAVYDSTDSAYRMIINGSGKVGIGITSPTADLHIHNSADHTRLNIDCSNSSGDNWQFQSRNNGEFWLRNDDNSRNDIVVYPSTGYVAAKNGLLFGTDTAAANALDDYEEGTWTPSFASGISVSSGTCNLAGTYTKIGNTVFIRLTATGTYVLSANAGAQINGLPFNIDFLNVGEGLAHDVSGGEKSICEFYSNQAIYLIDALGSAVAHLRVSGSYLPS